MQPAELEAQILSRWNFSDPAASATAFSTLLDSTDSSSPAAAVLLSQLARTHGLRNDFAAADETLGQAAHVATQLDPGPARDHALARIAIESGRVLNSSGSPDDARTHFENAYELAALAGTAGLAVDALHMQAIVAGQTTSPEASTELNERALEIAESSSDPAARAWRGSLLNNLGWDRHRADDHEGALDLFCRALDVRLEQGDEGPITIARWAVARALRSARKLDEALEIQYELAADPANADDGYIPEEIAECLLEKGEVEAAKSYFSRAHALLSQDPWLVEHEPERLARLAAYTRSESDAD